MKKIMILSLIVSIFSLVGCFNHEQVFESDYFTYSIYSNEVVILGLTNLGMEQETLIIPKEIDGYEVTSLGTESTLTSRAKGHIYSLNLKRIYLLNPIYISTYIFDLPELEYIFSLYYMPVSLYLVYAGEEAKYLDVTYSNHIQKEFELNYANLRYRLNIHADQLMDTYLIDYYENEIIGYKPLDPSLDGRVFLGWYKDVECTIPWNFEEDIVIFDDLNTETQLYAKWDK